MTRNPYANLNSANLKKKSGENRRSFKGGPMGDEGRIVNRFSDARMQRWSGLAPDLPSRADSMRSGGNSPRAISNRHKETKESLPLCVPI